MEDLDSRPPSGAPTAPPPLPRPVVPLGYDARGRAAGPGRPGVFLLRMAGGFFGYLLLSAAWAWLAVQLRLRGEVLWGVWVVVTGGLLALTLYLRVRFRIAGYGYGILTAMLLGMLLLVALVILVIGVCFGGLKM
jgi:hypothetical protein